MMSELPEPDGGSEPFTVDGSPHAAAPAPEFEGVNVCRVAALSMMFGTNRQAVRELAPELRTLGFPERLTFGQNFWAGVDPRELFPDLREQQNVEEGDNRIRQWQMLSETAQPQSASAFLVAVLGSGLERESAAAAAALWREIARFASPQLRRDLRHWVGWRRLDWADLDPFGPGWNGFPWPRTEFLDVDPSTEEDQEIVWNPEQWRALYERVMSQLTGSYPDIVLVRVLAQSRLSQALRSPDAVTRSLAMAAFLASDQQDNVAPPSYSPMAPTGALAVSTMIHGTWGWKGGWWRPRGDFHGFILRHHRKNLYCGGAKFSWSGAWRDSHREQAAIDFSEWAGELAPHGLGTVFAHSYGGEVAARALLDGARINELVLLSVPATNYVRAAVSLNLRVIDVRLHMDPVLALARLSQRIPPRPNVTTVVLNRWCLDHGATHKEHIWRQERVALHGAL